MAAADFVIHSITEKGIKESFDNAVRMEIMQYKDARLFDLRTTSEWTEIFTSTEGMSGSGLLTETQTPTLLSLDEGRKVSLAPSRYGAGVSFTEDDYEKAKDNTTKIGEILTRKRNALLVDVNHYFLTDVFGMYNNAFTTQLAPDGVALCGAHVDPDDNAWFTNSSTNAMGSTAVDSLMEYGGAFVDATGKQMPVSFDTIIVKKGGAAFRAAKKLFLMGIQPTQVADVNIWQGEFTVIESPMITSTNAWFAYDSKLPISMPLYVGVHKMPSMNEPIKQNDESVRMNATGYWKKGCVNMPINFFGSLGTGSGS